MSLWGRVFAAVYDRMLDASEREGLSALRGELLGEAHGRVLEIGAGTGLNLAHYGPQTGELVLTEPEEPMARRLEARLRETGRDARVIRASADDLPFADASFDTVVATLVLCTVPDVSRTLAEVRRVLVPGGRLLFLEHVRHSDPGRARRQDRLNGLQQRIACGCNCNRPTPQLIAASGMTLQDVRTEPFRKAFKYLQPLAVGSALR
jgi:ubiquinone/menaquinone biosynthesis C-methylase UbiE